ncbi:hypothetical protein DL766_009652 [Monosporascus sp. MC13-8B]|uniref:Uncharacterized protein n=1 Tax=Monosporascus cannonballus TaxID=155416 RepID=A0ABY0HCN5_9PEZI|nr:hypothetical protein DL762_002910 [Monosporascus cannonballus]RYP14509.1 hypothetical protein DL766_009652 [Monosporascus sp. MC13-8B]
MSLVNIEPENLSNLKDKTERINPSQGATTGIGAAVNRQLTGHPTSQPATHSPLPRHSIHAHTNGTQPSRQLSPKQGIRSKVVWSDVAEPPTPNARFVRTHATSYGSVLDLLKTALAAHGRIDHAVYSAGATGPGEDRRLFDTVTASPSSPIKEEPSTWALDVNLRARSSSRASRRTTCARAWRPPKGEKRSW